MSSVIGAVRRSVSAVAVAATLLGPTTSHLGGHLGGTRPSRTTTGVPGSGLVLGARTAVPSAQHSAFPGAARLPDGRLLLMWRQGSSHLSFDGDLWGATSADNGRTWTTPTTRYVMAGKDLRDPSLALIGGVLYLTFCTSQPGAYGNGVYAARSTDGGDTWTTAVRVDGGLPRAGESGPMVRIADGRLMQPFYGHPAGETRDSLYAAYSGDDAHTWTAQRVLNGQVDGLDYEEPWPTTTPAGTVRVYLRWGTADQIGSIDYDGSAWTKGHALWVGSGRPACVTNGAKVLCVYRSIDAQYTYRPALARLSKDGGATWAAPLRIMDGTAEMFTYAAPVVSGRGWVVPYAMQDGTTTSCLYVRTITPGRAL